MKKLLALTGRDLKSGLRDSMILYILIVPFLLAVILRMVTTSAGETTINIAVDNTVDLATVSRLERYGNVEVYEGLDDVRGRVDDSDDIFGITMDGERFSLIRQGDETEGTLELLQLIVNSTANAELEIPATVTVSDVGWRLSPIRQYGGSILAIFVSVFGGMIIMMNLVEEKQENTLAAMNVTPVERTTFVLGKGLLGFLVPLIQVFGVLFIMDYGPIDYLKVFVVTLAIATISVVIGFLIGVTNDNVIGAISSMKVLFIPILGSIFGAIFLREGLHFLFYWSPFYWAFRAMDPIILREAVWSNTLIYTGIILLISVLVFAGLRKRINKGLN